MNVIQISLSWGTFSSETCSRYHNISRFEEIFFRISVFSQPGGKHIKSLSIIKNWPPNQLNALPPAEIVDNGDHGNGQDGRWWRSRTPSRTLFSAPTLYAIFTGPRCALCQNPHHSVCLEDDNVLWPCHVTCHYISCIRDVIPVNTKHLYNILQCRTYVQTLGRPCKMLCKFFVLAGMYLASLVPGHSQ